jgi:hypothetical protein
LYICFVIIVVRIEMEKVVHHMPVSCDRVGDELECK